MRKSDPQAAAREVCSQIPSRKNWEIDNFAQFFCTEPGCITMESVSMLMQNFFFVYHCPIGHVNTQKLNSNIIHNYINIVRNMFCMFPI